MNSLKPLVDPIMVSTTFIHKKPGQMGYGRVDNPTRLELERRLARLEGARFALAFASGSAALSAVFCLMKAGDTVLRHSELYEGTSRMLDTVFSRFGIKNASVDFSDIAKLKNEAKTADLLICESVTNPTLSLLDMDAIGKMPRPKSSLLAVDNTVATPAFVKPLEKGADIVIHSLTKFIAGHHDAMAGTVMTNNRKLFERLKGIQWLLGAVPGTQDCFLVMRGMETLAMRMEKHQKNASLVSDFLKKQQSVRRVSFPGISGMVSFWVQANGSETVRCLRRLEHIHIAHSFGGTATTIMHPLSMMTCAELPPGNLLRLSVGVEDPDIIIQDLQRLLFSL